MIQLSNTDAERVCRHLEAVFKSRKNIRTSTKEINETRLLGLLLNKINRKLNKECPQRQVSNVNQRKK